MARLSLSPAFLKEAIAVFLRPHTWSVLFGRRSRLPVSDLALLSTATKRTGQWVVVDPIHRGRGEVVLLPHPQHRGKSLLLFTDTSWVTPGPDLWVYLSTSRDPKKQLGTILNLGLLQAPRGGQRYVVPKSFTELAAFQTAVIYCKQFAVLFTFATLK